MAVFIRHENCEKCGSFILRHNMSSGRFLNYCSNESCETRIDHPINKIIVTKRKMATVL